MIHHDLATEWRQRIDAALAERRVGLVDRVVVLDSVDSTQDECRARAEGQPGLVVLAVDQRRGRGRLGRRWLATPGQGLAMTLALPRQSPQRLAVAAGLALALALDHLGVREARLRWPNDVLVLGRKVAGVLIEQADELAFLGVGVNVAQTDWPDELRPVAISLAQVNLKLAVPDVALAILAALDETLRWSDDRLARAFERRDLLAGTVQTFLTAGRRVTGRVLRIDPLAGLTVQTRVGPVNLPALTTSLIHPHLDLRLGA